MVRPTVALLILMSGVLAVNAQRELLQAQDGTEKRIEIEPIGDRLFVLRGGGGNTAAFVTTNGVVLVDTKDPGWGQPLLDAVGRMTRKPVTMLVNTHGHSDHISGNVEFPDHLEIVAHENATLTMRKFASGEGTPSGRVVPAPNVFKPGGRRGMPSRTFTNQASIGAGADRIDLYYFGRGHTDGDAWVVFPALGAVHAGDMFDGKNLPLLDGNNGGSGVAFPDTLYRASKGLPNVHTIITGHGPQMTMSDLAEYADFCREYVEAVRSAKQRGQSVEDVVNSWGPSDTFRGYTTPSERRLKISTQVIYDELGRAY